jgi:hypothetical protein
VQQAVVAGATGRTPVEITASLDSGQMHPSMDFKQPYSIQGADNYLSGTGATDLLSPGVWVAHLRFTNGHTYHAEAQRLEGRWWVAISPGEGQ